VPVADGFMLLQCRRVCGVTPFYIPRSNPDGYAVTLACIEPSTIAAVTIQRFDGQDWDKSFSASEITSLSKDTVSRTCDASGQPTPRDTLGGPAAPGMRSSRLQYAQTPFTPF
jgi:hypothetical protein